MRFTSQRLTLHAEKYHMGFFLATVEGCTVRLFVTYTQNYKNNDYDLQYHNTANLQPLVIIFQVSGPQRAGKDSKSESEGIGDGGLDHVKIQILNHLPVCFLILCLAKML